MGNDTDERVDVYALGVLFYFMLTGEKPFVGDDDVAVLYQHVHNEPDRLDERLPAGHDIPQSILDLIHRALSKDPEDRPHNAGQFLFEFGACIDGTDISSPHVSGEFNTASRVARLSNLSPDDPSDQLSRQRRETPIHHLPADATPSHHSGLVALGADPSSGQVTWVSGEHLLKVEKQNRLRNIMLGVLGVLLIGGVAFYFYTQQAGVPSQDKVRADIAQAVTLIEDGKLGQAEGALEMVERDLQHYPDLKGDFVAAEDRLEIAQLMAEAGLFAEEGDLQEAIDAYKQVLSRNPNHERARSRKHAVRERLAASKPEASEEAQAESAEPADDSADQPEADLEVAKDEAPSPTPTPERSGAKAPQRTESAGAAKPTRSSGAKPKPAATKENAEKPAKASQTVEKQKVAKEKQQDKDSSDDSVLLPSDKAADSDDPTGGDLLPADDGSGGGDLLLD